MKQTIKMGVHPTYVVDVETDGKTIADACVDFNIKYKAKYDRDFDASGYDIRKNMIKSSMEDTIAEGDRVYFVTQKGDGMEVEQKLAMF
jgi:hypothetical protein